MSLLKLRIGGRLYGGFGALVLFCACLAGFAIWQLVAIRDQVGAMTLQSKNTVRAGEITTDLQAIRRGILSYLFDKDEASLADADNRLVRIVDLLEDAEKAAGPDEKAQYNSVIKDVIGLKARRAEIGGAIKLMHTGRNSLFSDDDKIAADVRKFVDAASGTAFAETASGLESELLLARIANWRMLATRQGAGFETFKANMGRAQQQISQMEKDELPTNLAAMLATVKNDVAKYGEAFAKTGPNLVLADQLYYKGITPAVGGAIEKMEKLGNTIDQAFNTTTAETGERIAITVTTQEIVAGAAVLAGLLIAFLIARSIARPLEGLTSGMKELAAGNFGVVLPGLDRTDEVGDMAQAVEIFKVKAAQKAREEADAKIKQDEFLASQRKSEMQKLATSFEAAVGEIVETVSSASTELEVSAGTLTANAEHAKALTTEVAAISDEASSNVRSVASAAEELSSSISEISRQVQESVRIASDAVDQSHNTTARIADLSKAAARIGDVVDLINTIAGQTNLLALNATIEAARAGDAGRGFAVVASEVKALAEQTAKATGEIAQQISGIQLATQDSVTAIGDISVTIGRLSEISSIIAVAVEEQGAATQTISHSVQQAAQGTQQVSHNVTDVQRGATQTGSASSQVLSAARSLSSDSHRLKVELGKFLDSVRAA
ncbi:MAG TPA: methyl-accepting chemotaxis protein [Bradyrhizobium sp.]|uniref:methyl-accepting chemotaxis protein n=1 Tax=Bradyrhizobium sp. TaxID=376 RepID=UPI002C6090D6|nr:methyl-accepting chemotaxis protein [Bradyrhizobium sp.]HLZ06066.1 methyl-accepting chemotaxis protein [Bradyrhizobium sp.]